MFDNLQALYVRIEAAREIIRRLVTEVGAKGHAVNEDYLCGAVVAFHFGETPPADLNNWVHQNNHAGWYSLRRSRKKSALRERIKDLPSIRNDELLNLLQLKGFQFCGEGQSLTLFRRPGINWGRDVILLSVPDGVKYAPIDGVEEILVSEFNQLKADIDAQNNEKE